MTLPDELAGFLRSIQAEPWDDTPRLILGDWLQDQAQPLLAARGQLIQVQCHLAAWVPDLDQRTALLQQEEQLLGANQTAWLGGLADCCCAVAFDRGLAWITQDAASWASGDVSSGQLRQVLVESVRLEGL